MCPKDYLIEQLKLQREWKLNQLRLQQEAAVASEAKANESKTATMSKEAVKKPFRTLIITVAEEERLIQEVLTAERIELLNTQPCPGCNVRIEKNGGCSHMHCSRCDLHFTWMAQTQLNAPVEGLFITQSSKGFMEVETVKEELAKVTKKGQPNEILSSRRRSLESINAFSENKYVDGQTLSAVTSDSQTQKPVEEEAGIVLNNRSAIGAAMLSRVRKCPYKQCNKLNVRSTNDNLITCSECMRTYCFLCGKGVNGLRHFPKKCQRYT